MEFEELLQIEPYSLNRVEKEGLLLRRLNELTRLHREGCPAYARILDSFSWDPFSQLGGSAILPLSAT